MLNEFKADWFFSDPYHTICSAVVLTWKIGFKNFIVQDTISTITANCLSVFSKLNTFVDYMFNPKGLKSLIALSSAGRMIIDLTKNKSIIL